MTLVIMAGILLAALGGLVFGSFLNVLIYRLPRGESIEEIARFVGHASAVTTAGYVRDLGNRPAAFAQRAAQLLDSAACGP